MEYQNKVFADYLVSQISYLALVLLVQHFPYTLIKDIFSVSYRGISNCYTCGKYANQYCTGCKMFMFCNKDCLSKGWHNHKDFCNGVKSLPDLWKQDVFELLVEGRKKYKPLSNSDGWTTFYVPARMFGKDNYLRNLFSNKSGVIGVPINSREMLTLLMVDIVKALPQDGFMEKYIELSMFYRDVEDKCECFFTYSDLANIGNITGIRTKAKKVILKADDELGFDMEEVDDPSDFLFLIIPKKQILGCARDIVIRDHHTPKHCYGRCRKTKYTETDHYYYIAIDEVSHSYFSITLDCGFVFYKFKVNIPQTQNGEFIISSSNIVSNVKLTAYFMPDIMFWPSKNDMEDICKVLEKKWECTRHFRYINGCEECFNAGGCNCETSQTCMKCLCLINHQKLIPKCNFVNSFFNIKEQRLTIRFEKLAEESFRTRCINRLAEHDFMPGTKKAHDRIMETLEYYCRPLGEEEDSFLHYHRAPEHVIDTIESFCRRELLLTSKYFYYRNRKFFKFLYDIDMETLGTREDMILCLFQDHLTSYNWND